MKENLTQAYFEYNCQNTTGTGVFAERFSVNEPVKVAPDEAGIVSMIVGSDTIEVKIPPFVNQKVPASSTDAEQAANVVGSGPEVLGAASYEDLQSCLEAINERVFPEFREVETESLNGGTIIESRGSTEIRAMSGLVFQRSENQRASKLEEAGFNSPDLDKSVVSEIHKTRKKISVNIPWPKIISFKNVLKVGTGVSFLIAGCTGTQSGSGVYEDSLCRGARESKDYSLLPKNHKCPPVSDSGQVQEVNPGYNPESPVLPNQGGGNVYIESTVPVATIVPANPVVKMEMPRKAETSTVSVMNVTPNGPEALGSGNVMHYPPYWAILTACHVVKHIKSNSVFIERTGVGNAGFVQLDKFGTWCLYDEGRTFLDYAVIVVPQEEVDKHPGSSAVFDPFAALNYSDISFTPPVKGSSYFMVCYTGQNKVLTILKNMYIQENKFIVGLLTGLEGASWRDNGGCSGGGVFENQLYSGALSKGYATMFDVSSDLYDNIWYTSLYQVQNSKLSDQAGPYTLPEIIQKGAENYNSKTP